MTFEQLDCFLSAVESDTFLDAAESLHMTQSTLSKQITKLEKETNMILFDRSHRTATLTKEGEMFYPEAKAMIKQYRKTLSHIKDYQEGKNHTLKIGTLPIMPRYGLTDILKSFEKKYPHIHVYVEEGDENELLQGLDEGLYDFVFIFACNSMTPAEQYALYPMAQDNLTAIMPVTHPLAMCTSVSVKELYNQLFVLMKPTTAIYHICMDFFKENGVNVRISFTGRPETIVAAILDDEGISLLPNEYFTIFDKDALIAVPVQPASPITIVAARKKKMTISQSVRTFIDYLKTI